MEAGSKWTFLCSVQNLSLWSAVVPKETFTGNFYSVVVALSFYQKVSAIKCQSSLARLYSTLQPSLCRLKSVDQEAKEAYL